MPILCPSDKQSLSLGHSIARVYFGCHPETHLELQPNIARTWCRCHAIDWPRGNSLVKPSSPWNDSICYKGSEQSFIGNPQLPRWQYLVRTDFWSNFPAKPSKAPTTLRSSSSRSFFPRPPHRPEAARASCHRLLRVLAGERRQRAHHREIMGRAAPVRAHLWSRAHRNIQDFPREHTEYLWKFKFWVLTKVQ